MEEDPCETCLFKIRCKEICGEGTKYHKEQMLLILGEANLRRFKLDALLLVIPMKIDEFLQKYPSLEEEIDNIQDGNELLKRMNVLAQEKSESRKMEKGSKSQKTKKLNLFVEKNKRKKNFKGFISRIKELIKKEETK